MVRTIKISDKAITLIEGEIKTSKRSLGGQAEHWMNIGRAIEQSSAFDYERIKTALAAQIDYDNLTIEEQEVFFNDFSDSMWEEPSAETQSFFDDLSGPGLDENDNIVSPGRES